MTWHWLLHSWGKWRTYEHSYVGQYRSFGVEVGGRFEAVELRQRRQCLICGLVQDQQVRIGPDAPGVTEQLARERVEAL